MKTVDTNRLYYLTANSRDEDWDIATTTVGHQIVLPKEPYPLSTHPTDYQFNPKIGRVLNEYQLLYIVKGSGYFTSMSCKKCRIEAGTVIMLFPNEWHSYYPDYETGWDEYWVGFKGVNIDKRVNRGFFSKNSPIYHIGSNLLMNNLYEDIIKYADLKKIGCQQIISGMILCMLGMIYYKENNQEYSDTYMQEKINQACVLIEKSVEEETNPEDIARQLGLGYSCFRRRFKEYTGISPAQYKLQQKYLRAKELITSTNMSLSEIAYLLRFDSACQFSTFFKKREGMSPSEFRSNLRESN